MENLQNRQNMKKGGWWEITRFDRGKNLQFPNQFWKGYILELRNDSLP